MTFTAGRAAPEAGLPARCRVTGTIAPEVGVEVWLPIDDWNGRLLVAGCYGLCGSIRTDTMADAAARGYATATTDGGHSGERYPDSRWALNNESLEEDFGHRAVHVTTDVHLDPHLPIDLSCDFNVDPMCWVIGQHTAREAWAWDEIVLEGGATTQEACQEFLRRHPGSFPAGRAQAVRKLSDMKERSSLDFLTRLYQDPADAPEVRAEAGLTIAVLGDVRSIPVLISGVLNPDERIRTASARGLSMYPEEQTREPLVNMIESPDPMRKGAFMRALADGGWRPLGVLTSLAKSKDARTANMAVETLGMLQDPQAVEFLLGLLNEPGAADPRTVIVALGAHRSSPWALANARFAARISKKARQRRNHLLRQQLP